MKGKREEEDETESEIKVPRLLTAQHLSARTGIAYWRILELVKKGEGPPVMWVGNTMRFPEDGVVEWINERCSRKEA